MASARQPGSRNQVEALLGGQMRSLRAPQRHGAAAAERHAEFAGRAQRAECVAAIAVATTSWKAARCGNRRGAGKVCRRRPPFQRCGEVPVLEGEGNFTVIDDYGHHTVEMAAS